MKNKKRADRINFFLVLQSVFNYTASDAYVYLEQLISNEHSLWYNEVCCYQSVYVLQLRGTCVKW